jgi:hypothetical protein
VTSQETGTHCSRDKRFDRDDDVSLLLSPAALMSSERNPVSSRLDSLCKAESNTSHRGCSTPSSDKVNSSAGTGQSDISGSEATMRKSPGATRAFDLALSSLGSSAESIRRFTLPSYDFTRGMSSNSHSSPSTPSPVVKWLGPWAGSRSQSHSPKRREQPLDALHDALSEDLDLPHRPDSPSQVRTQSRPC